MSGLQIMKISSAEQTMAMTEQVKDKSAKLQGVIASFSSYMQQTQADGPQVAVDQQQKAMAEKQPAKDAETVQGGYEKYQSKASERLSSAASETDQYTAADTVQDAVEEVKSILKEELGISDEQLDEVIELLGLTQVELLVPQNLIAITMEVTGTADAGLLLLNENFQNILQQATEITQELLGELGMSLEEVMERFMPQQDVKAVPQQADEPQQAQVEVKDEPQQAQLSNRPVTENVKEQPQQAVERSVVQTAVQKQPEEQASRQVVEGSVSESLAEDTVKAPVAEKSQQQEGEPQQQEEEAFTKQEEAALPQADEAANENEAFQRVVHHAPVEQHAVEVPQSNVMPQAPQIDVQNVIEQIVEYSRVNITDNVKTLEMQLNPENLGKIYLHITEKNGAVTAQITAQNEELKEALVQQAATLRENLSQQGVKVQAVEVSVGTHEFEENLEKDARQQEEQARQQEERTERRSRRSIDLNDMDSLSGLLSEEEALVAKIMRDNGNNVDYKA